MVRQPGYELFFIAIVLPPPVSNEVIAYQQYMAEHYHSRKALRTVPHITLKAPFTVAATEKAALLQWFATLPIQLASFWQNIDGFGAFHNRRNPVLFLQPVVAEPLRQLQQCVVRQWQKVLPGNAASPSDFQFHPHITIAYRDLSVPSFIQAWQAFQNEPYRASFVVSRIHMLHHNGKQWQIVSSCQLQN